MALARLLNAAPTPFDDAAEFANVNTPADLANAKRRLI